jgi:diguanylate cyclase (GGDEF)-like protein/PAS domain S-box-containing protein
MIALAERNIGPGTHAERDYRAIATVIITAFAVGLTAWGGVALARRSVDIATVWPANGILLAILLNSPRRHWPRLLVAGITANVAAHGLLNYPLRINVGMSAANLLEILIAAAPFLREPPGRTEFTRLRMLSAFVLYGAVLAPVASGLLMAAIFGHTARYPFPLILRNWYMADALGMMIFAPLTQALLQNNIGALFHWKRLPETAALLTLLVAAATVIFHEREFPILFPLFPLVMLVVFRLGLAGSATGIALMAVPCTIYTLRGVGPFAAMTARSPGTAILLLQLFFLMLILLAYLISAVLARQKRLEAALRHSELRYRALAETSRDIILRTTLEGYQTYISPSVEELLGWPVEALYGKDTSWMVHPEDLPRIEVLLDSLREKPENQSIVFRVQKKSGEYAWMEARVGAVMPPSGTAEELVWTIRDISARIAFEQQLSSEKQRAETLASLDGMTGLANRRRFDEMLPLVWQRAAQDGSALSLLMLDVDHFKDYNDIFGHPKGDECLRRVAKVIAGCIRQPGDFAARYGGEEFTVILPGATEVRALEVAERIRAEVAALRIEHSSGLNGYVTITVGSASSQPAEAQNAEELVQMADLALYDGKRAGRNRVAAAR